MDFRDVQEIEGDAGSDDIRDGIDCADFMEVNFFNRHAVDTGFGLALSEENGGSGGLCVYSGRPVFFFFLLCLRKLTPISSPLTQASSQRR